MAQRLILAYKQRRLSLDFREKEWTSSTSTLYHKSISLQVSTKKVASLRIECGEFLVQILVAQ